jgi:hypothetical protein
VLLILPVYALYHVSSAFGTLNTNTSNATCVGILLVATLLFSAVLALFTKARRHEILGASAASVYLIYYIASPLQNANRVKPLDIAQFSLSSLAILVSRAFNLLDETFR